MESKLAELLDRKPESTPVPTQKPSKQDKSLPRNSWQALRAAPDGVDAEADEMSPGLREIVAGAIRKGMWPIYLHGEAGRGKTSAMACVYRAWRAGHPTWLRLSQFVSMIQQCRRNGQIVLPGSHREVGESSLWRVRVDQPGLLCVDDIGLRNPTESQFEIVYELVDRRGCKPVIYTSNLSPSTLQKTYDGRILSRMLQGLSIEVAGNDRRLSDSVSTRAE